MASTHSTRFWRVHKEAGRPIPLFSDDDVLDYMVLEAIALKVKHEDAQVDKKVEKKQWKKDTSNLDKYR